MQEGLIGLRVLRLSGRAGGYTARVGDLARAQADAELATTRLGALLAPVYTVGSSAGIVAVLWLGGQRVAAGSFSVGDLVAFLALFTRFTARAYRIPQMLNRVQAGRAAYTRVAPLLAPPAPRSAEPAHASFLPGRVAGGPPAPAPPPPRRTTGPAAVSLRGVTFTYPGAAAPALLDVDLELAAGSLVAVTGPVGAGASALARLVLGLFEPDCGEVLLDGVPPAALRDELGYLPQGHPVFAGTVAGNVLLDVADSSTAGAGDLDRVGAALSVARLAEEVAALPAGVATSIGEAGVTVSGGQRQRLALARALAAPARTPRLLVLDDPFSAVDVGTETELITGLRAAVGPSAPVEERATVLLCSARLAVFPQADLVVVLREGRVVERGTHTELLELGGLYAGTFRAQGAVAAP